MKAILTTDFYQPFKEDKFEQNTVVPIIYPVEPNPVFCEFDWELDNFQDFTRELIEAEELSADQKDAFEARDARQKAIADMSAEPETKAAFDTMRFYKFYPVPSPDAPDVSSVKSPFINRYYRKAHEVL